MKKLYILKGGKATMADKPRHNSKPEIREAAKTLADPNANKREKSLAGGILADIPRKKQN